MEPIRLFTRQNEQHFKVVVRVVVVVVVNLHSQIETCNIIIQVYHYIIIYYVCKYVGGLGTWMDSRYVDKCL